MAMHLLLLLAAASLVATISLGPTAAAEGWDDPAEYVLGHCPSEYPVGVYVKGQYNLCCRQPGPNLKDWLFRVLFQDWLSQNCIWV